MIKFMTCFYGLAMIASRVYNKIKGAGMSNSNYTTAIQYMGMIMRQQNLNIDYVLAMVEIVNNSFLSAKDIVTILEEIFRNEKSAKILLATQVLEYLVKNGNRNFHQAANKESFQKSLLGLLKRQRGKMSLLKQIRSNTENWSKIESRALYLIQLWYDAFILEESKYPYIINNYKILRKENVIFPPRNVNERSLLAVKTESPIFDNIESIAESDKEKFKKRLNAMGLAKLSQKFDQKQEQIRRVPQGGSIGRTRQVNIDDVSQKIAIIQSQDYDVQSVLKVIEQLKEEIEFGRVKPHEEKYWATVRQAAEQLIVEWEEKNAQFIQEKEQRYLESKMFAPKPMQAPDSPAKKETREVFDLLGEDPADPKDEHDDWGQYSSPQEEQPAQGRTPNQLNLLDL